MTVLVTGGLGFIGRHLVDRLLAAGQTVRIVDDLSTGSPKDLGANAAAVELVVGDIADPDLALSACRGVETIFHLAANTGVGPSVADPAADCRANVIGTFNYLEGARQAGTRRFVFASSSAVVGSVEPPIHETLPARPMSPYGASKLAGEGYCSAYFHCFGIDTVALRFGNVYGPRSSHKASVVAKFIRMALAGQPLTVYGDGTQTRDFIFIDDLIEVALAAATRPGVGGEAFQIATARETTVAQLVALMAGILERRAGITVTVQGEKPRVGDVQRSWSQTDKAARLLGWQARTGLAEGLDRTVAWFVEGGRG